MAIDPTVKVAGLLAPVFALRHKADFGIGDTLAVKDAIDFCHEQGFALLQVLPVNETGGDNSPYNAISSVALDPAQLALTPETVPGLTDDILLRIAPDRVLKPLREGAVKYAPVKALKLTILAEAFGVFEANDLENETPLAQEFATFVQKESDWLAAYTLFRMLMNEYDGSVVWTWWREEHQTIEEAEQWVEASSQGDDIARNREFLAYVQWVAFRQWRDVKQYANEHGIRLVGDMPFGVSRYSADVWARRDLFDLDWSGGAPPEPMFDNDLFVRRWGQNWGMPLYRWEEHEAQDYVWWKQRVAKILECFHTFRIDHVMGFFRIYSFPWIPEKNEDFVNLSHEEAAAKTGGLLPQFIPADDDPKNDKINEAAGEKLMRVFLSVAGPDGIVAEDLGTVPNYVRPLLQKLGIPGYVVPAMQRDEPSWEYEAAADYPELAVVTYATHDHDPLITFYEKLVRRWTGPEGDEGWKEMQRLMRFLGLDENNPPTTYTPALHEAFLRRLLLSPSCWAFFMVTDMIASHQRFNLPGTNSSDNWSERLDFPLHDYLRDPVHAPKVKLMAELIKETGRAPQS